MVKKFKVKYQILISLEAFKVSKLEFYPLGNQKRHSALDPIVQQQTSQFYQV